MVFPNVAYALLIDGQPNPLMTARPVADLVEAGKLERYRLFGVQIRHSNAIIGSAPSFDNSNKVDNTINIICAAVPGRLTTSATGTTGTTGIAHVALGVSADGSHFQRCTAGVV